MAAPYIGSKISLISISDIRYEGTLFNINTQESTVSLSNVKSFGTEGRRVPEVPPSDEVYDYIIFKGKDIKDLTVCENVPAQPTRSAPPNDPAIVSAQSGGAGGPPRSPMQSGMGGPGGYPQHMGHPGGYNQGHMGGGYGQHMNGAPAPPSRGGYGGQQGGWGGHRGGYGGGYGGQRGGRMGPPMGGGYDRRQQHDPSHIVGELAPQPNTQIKEQLGSEFDFSSANAKLQSMKAEESSTAAPAQSGTAYNKRSSFFDSLSCEAIEKAAGRDQPRFDREKQRKTDTETFGDTNLPRAPRAFNYRRGGGRGGMQGGRGGMQHPSRYGLGQGGQGGGYNQGGGAGYGGQHY